MPRRRTSATAPSHSGHWRTRSPCATTDRIPGSARAGSRAGGEPRPRPRSRTVPTIARLSSLPSLSTVRPLLDAEGHQSFDELVRNGLSEREPQRGPGRPVRRELPLEGLVRRGYRIDADVLLPRRDVDQVSAVERER